MKKLCTYLTLFVLGLLALAQPAAAKDYTFYFRLPSSGWTTPPGFHWWGFGTNANVDGSTTSPVSMKLVAGESNLYSVTLKDANETGGNIMFKTNGGSWNPQTTAITELKDGYIYEITGGSGQNCTCEPKEEYTQGGSVTKMYIRGEFTGTESVWGDNPDVMMPYNEDLGLYYYEPSSAGDFMISTTCGTSFWDGRHQNMAESGKLTLPGSKPESQNIKTGGDYGRDLTLPALGTIYFDKNEMKIWYEEPAVDPVDYTFYLNPGTVAWSDVYVYLFGSSDSKWNGVYEHYTTKLSNGYYKFEVKGVTKAGNMLFKSNNTGNWLNDKTDQSRDIEGTNVKNGALYTLGEMYIDNNNKKGYNYTVTEDYQEPGAKPVLTANPAGGEFETSVSVTLSATPACDIYYTTNGTEPSAASSKYSSPLSFTATTTLKAVAILDGVSSEVLTATYTKGTPEVLIQPSSTTFETSLDVTITATPSDAKIYYTTDGTEPSIDGTSYNSPVKFTITSTTTVKAIAVINGEQSATQEGVFRKTAQKLYIRGTFTGTNEAWGKNEDVEFPYDEASGLYTYTASKSGGFMISTTTGGDTFWNGRFKGANSEKRLNVPTSKPTSANIATNGSDGYDLYIGNAGTIYFDYAEMKIWYEPKQETLPTALYAKGPACNNDWNSWATLTGTDGVFSFDIIAQGEFLITDSNSDDGIYSLDGASSIPVGKANAAKIKRSRAGNMTAPAANGKIFIDMNELKIWYEPKSFSDTKLYIRAAFIGDNEWGAEKWNKEMTWNESEGVYVWDATSAKTGDQFMISWNMDMWNHKFACYPIPTEKPSTPNVNDDNGSKDSDLILPKPGYIKYDPVNKILWVAPEQAVLPTLYTFYVKIDDVYASQWGDDTCYLYTFDEGDDKWTSINGQCVKYDRRLADGVYKFVVRGQTSKGRMLFKNTAAVSDMQEYSGTILPADIRPRALYTISAKGEVSVAPEDYVETNVFEAGKAYYVDASACSWFENADCTLGVEYDGHVHFGGTIVKVSSDPLVYRFTVDEDQTEIVVGRRNKDGLHNPVTVQAPTDGSNCIYVKEDNGNLVFDSWGSYSPAGGLYILGSSNAIDGDWKSATPIAMNYDEAEGVYYYMVQGTNASADNPIEFLISRGASNADFFKAENAFMPVHDGYIHMAEPSYMKGKPGYTDGNYFKLISRGRVMAKYIKAENSEEITGLKIWYEPVVWPDLYILGSIIADPDDTKDIQSTNEQWHTFQKLVKDDKQPGLYYYDLGRNGNEHLFNEKPYPVTGGVFGDIDEHGHFNFSFLSDTDTGEFWKDAFVPAVGQGMGTLNRDGVPVPFQYRDSKPDQTEWVSTNFVFGERSRIWVDVVRQLVWIETFTELSGNQVVFDFWDKGGDPYPKADGYQWWTSNDKSTYKIQAFIKNADETKIPTESPYTFQFTDEHNDLNWQASEAIDNVGSGVRYHFVAELPKSFYELDSEGNATDKVIDGGYLWIRITDVNNAKHVIERPYAYQATYTQGPKGSDESINYNYYGNILAAGDPIVTIEPSVNMIYADVEAPEHLGLFRESHIMHYPYVNQYSTAVTVNPGNVYPFWVDGLTEPAKNDSGETIADQYVPVDGARVVFEKSNQVTVSYGSIRETKYGTTGMAVIKGIDHANAADDDKMEVTVTYTSPGLIFARTKTEPLKIDANELPTMQTSQDTPLDVAAFYSGTACNQGLTVDLILHQKFEFRDIMTQGRAAYIGYEVKIDNPNDHSHVAEGHEHMAKNGVPLMWYFKDDQNRDIEGFTDLDKWHYKAFTGKSMAIQLHHVLCGNTEADLEGKTVTGSVTFHLYVPVATEFAFETGTTSLVRGMHKAGEQVNSSVLGDPNHPYTGSVSAKSYDTLKHNIDFSFGVGNITTGVEGVGVDDAPVEFYNLQGVRMTSDALAPGIYIRRQGNETSKVYIR